MSLAKTNKIDKQLLLIDGHSLLYRAFYAYPAHLTNKEGTPVNAVYGFMRMLLNTIMDREPSHIAVAFDVGKTFRHERYSEYKAHREKMPDELKVQEPIIFQLVTDLAIPVFTKKGYEADDVLGTLAIQAAQEGVNSTILTGDKDSLQLVSDRSTQSAAVQVFTPAIGKRPAVLYNEAMVFQKLQLHPKQVIEYKALAGDTSDNIPGVKGIGKKTATKLLQHFDTIQHIYGQLVAQDIEIPDSFTQRCIPQSRLQKGTLKEKGLTPSVLRLLASQVEQAYLSHELATIDTQVPVTIDIEACKITDYDKEHAIKALRELGFTSLLKRLPDDAFEVTVKDTLTC